MKLKRILLAAACLCLLAAALLVVTFATEVEPEIVAHGTCGAAGDNLTWTLDSVGTLTINGTGEMEGYNEFRTPWGSYKSQIKKILIASGVTSIGSYAFKDCSNLTSITIPEGVTYIGRYAFYGCSTLTSVTIPDSVTSIGNYAFSCCSALTSVTIPNSLTSIGNYVFYCCRALTSVTIPNSVTSAGYYAFRDCSALTSVTIPNGVTSIWGGAFYGCNALTSVTIPNSVTNIGGEAFYGCSALKSITLPESLLNIGHLAFYCTHLTEINYNAKNLKITNPVFSNAGRDTGGIDVIFGESVEKIPSKLFSGSTIETQWDKPANIKSVTISENVTSIGDAFAGCTGLERIYYNAKSVKSASLCFKDAGDATGNVDIIFGEAVEVIPEGLFYANKNLKEITIPENVKSIGECAFAYCTGLMRVNYNARSATVDLASTSSSAVDAPNVFAGAGTETEGIIVAIGDTVEAIPAKIFYGYRFGCDTILSPTIKAVTISKNVTSIGEAAFRGCKGLTSITIPEGVTSIGSGAFAGCEDLTRINYNAKAATVSTSGAYYYDLRLLHSSDRSAMIFGKSVKKIPAWWANSFFFTGHVPSINVDAFNDYDFRETYALYPIHDTTWTAEFRAMYKKLKWVGYCNTDVTEAKCAITKTGYLPGEPLDVKSLTMTVAHSDGCTETISWDTALLSLSSYDMSTPGKKQISVSYRDVTAELVIYVHAIEKRDMASTDYPESKHDYENNTDETYTYCAPGAYTLEVTFSSETMLETNVDYLYVNETAYTGTSLAGKTLTIDGDTLNLRLVSDDNDTTYGFSIDSIVAFYKVHEYSSEEVVQATCTEQGYTIHKCICGELIEDTFTDALGHDMVTDPAVPATCEATGLTEGSHCSRCDYKVEQKETPIDPNNHVGPSHYDHDGQHHWTVCDACGGKSSAEDEHSYGEDHVCVVCGYLRGFAVSGTVESFLDENGSVTLSLINGGEVKYTTSVTGNTAHYCFDAVAPATYTLRVEKAGHVMRTYEITVTDIGVAQDAKICPYGDIDGDGETGMLDMIRLYNHINETEELTDYAYLCADVDGDGEVGMLDMIRLYGHINETEPLY